MLHLQQVSARNTQVAAKTRTADFIYALFFETKSAWSGIITLWSGGQSYPQQHNLMVITLRYFPPHLNSI